MPDSALLEQIRNKLEMTPILEFQPSDRGQESYLWGRGQAIYPEITHSISSTGAWWDSGY